MINTTSFSSNFQDFEQWKFLKNFYLFTLDKEREEEGEKHQCVVASHMAPTGDLTWPATQAYALARNRTGNPLVRRPALNPLNHTSQG